MARDLLKPSYRLSDEAPPPMPWAEYDRRVRLEWGSLLEGRPSEPGVQRFLESHPALVPGAHSALGRMKSGHAPFPSALIAQPALQGITKRTPDFLWISTDSAFLNPVFVEIEAPDKRWLTARGHQHHHLTQALHQLDEWEEWFDQPANQQVFYETYRIPELLRRRRFEPLWVLVYGRRDEDPDGVSKLRARLRTETRMVIPYDHLEPDEDARDYLCVRESGGRYVAITVPPTVRVGPSYARDWSIIEGKQDAAAAASWLSPERREFLVDRFPYWDDWAKEDPSVARPADLE